MNFPAVHLTGLGLATPLGLNVKQNWQALSRGEYISDHSRAKLDRSDGRIFQISKLAADEAIAQARWDHAKISGSSTALIVGTSKGAIVDWINSEKSVAAANDCGIASCATRLTKDLRWGDGPRITLSAACASGLHALIHATMLIRSGAVRRALVVAAEASVHPLFVGSFKRLGVLAPEGAGCRPFDVNRNGFVISECAAAVCLESDESSDRVATIDRMAMAADSTHLIRGDAQGKILRRVLQFVIDNRKVELIHAHATGTQLNDQIELAAIDSVVRPDSTPSVFSHKAALGHSLGASGMVSIVLNCRMMSNGNVLGNTRTFKPIAAGNLSISREAVDRPINRSVAIAAGFGGAVAAVSLLGVGL